MPMGGGGEISRVATRDVPVMDPPDDPGDKPAG
jgi:hypothetical protein